MIKREDGFGLIWLTLILVENSLSQFIRHSAGVSVKSNDLPVLPKSSRDTYDSVINDVEEVLVDELYGRLHFIGNGMVDPVFHIIMDVLWSFNR